jgi:hypothetical protein
MMIATQSTPPNAGQIVQAFQHAKNLGARPIVLMQQVGWFVPVGVHLPGELRAILETREAAYWVHGYVCGHMDASIVGGNA